MMILNKCFSLQLGVCVTCVTFKLFPCLYIQSVFSWQFAYCVRIKSIELPAAAYINKHLLFSMFSLHQSS